MMAPFLLCTDLDRTLLPNGAQPESPEARRLFGVLAKRPEVVLAFVSGRDLGLVQRAIKSYSLPTPTFVISDVGTNIYDHRQGDWQVLGEWQQEIAPDWNGLSHGDVRDLLSDLAELRLQELSKQNTYKLSYYVSLHSNQVQLADDIDRRLAERDVRASQVWSIDEPAGIGLLDILPRCATKLHAVEFLQRFLGIRNDRILFAGDSGNDLPVLTSPIPSVLVANAMESVQQEALAKAHAAGTEAALYLAKGDFLGMNGNYSAGILEGVAHFHADYLPVLQQGLSTG